MGGDREPAKPDPVGGDGRTLWSLFVYGTDVMSFFQKSCRDGRGGRADTLLVRISALVAFPFIVSSLGTHDLRIVYAAWWIHVGILLVMALRRRRLQRLFGPMHSRFVGWSLPEKIGMPPTLSRLLIEPALWLGIGICVCELGFMGLGNFYCIGALCLIPDSLLLTQKELTLTTDAVDARIEAEVRIDQIRSKLGG